MKINIFKTILLVLILFRMGSIQCQDTFSIVATDPSTGEVGSAGASCVNLVGTGLEQNYFAEEVILRS